jgi:predicted component of type VI protein secretion system
MAEAVRLAGPLVNPMWPPGPPPHFGLRRMDGSLIVVEHRDVVLGRMVPSAGRLDDPLVSARHAAVRVRAGTIEVRDLGSTNGTWLDGRRVTAARLRDGETLRLGRTLLRVLAPPAPDAPAGLPAPRTTATGPVERPAKDVTCQRLLGDWEALISLVPEGRSDRLTWLAERAGLPFTALDFARRVRNQVAHPTAPLNGRQVQRALRLVEDAARRIRRGAEATGRRDG